ncbi:restriction endonuclease subunit S [Mammaliicoccus vitulinus]|uniref:restriction endonuclease subunit S n=1 Tax=Mammaliicoccus vitulinus TaxID=71237 RepID=UPI0003092654|nr:restriction endonuclease subunit S [Mammaliicoccus vitulinus]
MEYKVSEVVKIISGGTPKRKNSEYWNGEIPWLSVKDFNNKNRLVHETEEQITEAGLNNSAATLVSKGTVVISARGTVGELCQVAKSMTFNQSCFGLEAISKYTTNEYIYYWFKYKTNYIKSNTHGSVFDTINRKTFENLYIYLPNISYQKQVVNILKTLDNKIEINQNIIANLEELSQTLFKRWFVDFEFPDENGNPYKSSAGEMVDSELGMIPKGWEIITINDFANNNVITGKTPSTKIKENYSETGIPFLTIPDMHNDIFALNTERYISELGIEKLSKKVLPKNSLSISCIATPGLISIIANDTLTNQQINSFTPNENALYYLYFKLKGMKDYIRDLGSGGSATLNLNKTQFSKIKLVKPINEILYKYDKLVSPNFKMILNIQKEIQQLTQLRDTLLPKLMSGEIEIPDDIEVNEDELSI